MTGKSEKSKNENGSKTSLIHIVDGPESLKAKYNKTPGEQKESSEKDGERNGKSDSENKSAFAKLKKSLILASIILASFTLIIVIINEIFYQIGNKKTREKLAVLQKSVLAAAEAQNEPVDSKKSGQTSGESDSTPVEPTEPVILPEYEALYNMNRDFVGWIKIDDTEINYPVMQTKWNNEFYLERDFDCNDDHNGLPFVDKNSDVFKPTTNILVYGHSMNSGLMFAALLKYKDEAFFKKHPVIHFDTLYEHGEYEIVAAFRSRIADKSEETFRYYTFFDTDSEDEFNIFIKNVKQLSYYETGIKPTFGDELLTLSTCDKTLKDGRMVIVARKVSTH